MPEITVEDWRNSSAWIFAFALVAAREIFARLIDRRLDVRK